MTSCLLTRHLIFFSNGARQHHYLGYRQIVGNHLKYIALIDERPVACLGWGSAAWSVKSRDSFIGWNKASKEKNLHFVANNTRSLILPWVSVKCMASHLLALNAKRISDDWVKIYNHPLYLLETFVEKNRFRRSQNPRQTPLIFSLLNVVVDVLPNSYCTKS